MRARAPFGTLDGLETGVIRYLLQVSPYLFLKLGEHPRFVRQIVSYGPGAGNPQQKCALESRNASGTIISVRRYCYQVTVRGSVTRKPDATLLML
jgi:hypothetical protein